VNNAREWHTNQGGQSMYQMHTPLDPNCPNNPLNRPYDPMDSYCGCMDEINSDMERRHQRDCKRCQEYGAANIEVID
jgi:hypothetical protein